MAKVDLYGRIWGVEVDDLCSVCGQPDNGACSHEEAGAELIAAKTGLSVLGLRVSLTAGCLVYHGELVQANPQFVTIKVKGIPHTLPTPVVTRIVGPLHDGARR